LIKHIFYDRVIVDAGNGEESVKLRQSLFAGVKLQPESTQPLAPLQVFGSRPPEGRNFQTVYLESEAAKSLFSDIDEVLKKVRIEPVSVYGRPSGIRISTIEAGSVFSEIGLKSGEVIRELDGAAVSGPEDAVAFFQKIKGGGEFDISVKGRRTRYIHLIVE
jgi:type II secretory pathway component PulC